MRKLVLLFVFTLLAGIAVNGQHPDALRTSFVAPPDDAKPRVYWFWLFNRVDKEGIARDLEQFKAKGITGVNLICTGGYAGAAPLPGVKYQSPEWWDLFRYAATEARHFKVELGFNLSAGGWVMEAPWVTPDNAMKKIVQAKINMTGPIQFSGTLPLPDTVDGYYRDYCIQAFPSKGPIRPEEVIDLTDKLQADGCLEWRVPQGQWTILRTGYTLTGSRWRKYPGGDTFEGGDGYELDALNPAALDDHFEHLGKPILDAVRQAGGNLAYFWSDSWESGKLTWTQDFPNQFLKYRGYDLKPYLPALTGGGAILINDDVTARFRADFDRTIQDCIADNFYRHFADLCHRNGVQTGSEAGGPNDIPPEDALKNLGRGDFGAGEFWVNGHYKASGGYNADSQLKLNLKQTASAAHVYGQRQVQAESFTQQEADRTHWSLGPTELKPYANDAFCWGINRIMLHQATCQPPSDGKPGYEFCAGQHFNPNATWWEQSPAFFAYLSRCSYMLQQGNFAADVCFYLGEEPPTLAPPKYIDPTLGPGYDFDYCNAEVLLQRMSVVNGQIMLPDGLHYRLLVLQNCVSPSPEIARKVGDYQGLTVSPIPSKAMSVEVIQKLRQLILDGATIVGAPPEKAAGLKDYPACDGEVQRVAAEIWGDLDGKTRTERHFGKGRVIWGKTPREVLLADGIAPDFVFSAQTKAPDDLDFIHRTSKDAEIYFVINRRNQPMTRDLTFRITGRQPEIFDPVSGNIRPANAFRQAGGRTTLPLTIDRFGSYFIVFRKSIDTGTVGKAKRNFPQLVALKSLTGPWRVSFDTAWGGPENAGFPELISWTRRPEDGIKFYSGKATYHKTFDLPQGSKPQQLFLDLGDVHNVADVRLNGKELGVLWCFPWRVDITGAVKPKGNVLEVDVIDLWANRVIGDLNLPKEKRLTKTHDVFRFDMITPKTPLLDAGLLGPVRLLAADRGAR
jgi:hypothetical protein